jgi:prevent-host-death family protein
MAMSRKRSRVGSAEFKDRCLELIEIVRESRTELVVTRHGRPVAKVVPYTAAPDSRALLGSMAGTVVVFDAPFDPVPGLWDVNGETA